MRDKIYCMSGRYIFMIHTHGKLIKINVYNVVINLIHCRFLIGRIINNIDKNTFLYNIQTVTVSIRILPLYIYFSLDVFMLF